MTPKSMPQIYFCAIFLHFFLFEDGDRISTCSVVFTVTWEEFDQISIFTDLTFLCSSLLTFFLGGGTPRHPRILFTDLAIFDCDRS